MSLKNSIVLGLFFTVFVGCGNGVPSDLLQPKQMEELMMDMVVVDSYSDAVVGLNSRDKKTEWLSSETDKVLAIRKISKDKFLKSYNFIRADQICSKLLLTLYRIGLSAIRIKFTMQKSLNMLND